MNELAKAFEGEPEEVAEKAKETKVEKRRVLPVITFLIGLVVLAAGVAFLVVKLAQRSSTSDAERLVEIGTFVKDGEDDVIWQFTEVGKGTLTTNNHTNDYDFIWAIEDGKLKIETAWLYDLNDEYAYKIDGEKLVLDEKIVFVPAGK